MFIFSSVLCAMLLLQMAGANAMPHQVAGMCAPPGCDHWRKVNGGPMAKNAIAGGTILSQIAQIERAPAGPMEIVEIQALKLSDGTFESSDRFVTFLNDVVARGRGSLGGESKMVSGKDGRLSVASAVVNLPAQQIVSALSDYGTVSVSERAVGTASPSAGTLVQGRIVPFVKDKTITTDKAGHRKVDLSYDAVHTGLEVSLSATPYGNDSYTTLTGSIDDVILNKMNRMPGAEIDLPDVTRRHLSIDENMAIGSTLLIYENGTLYLISAGNVVHSPSLPAEWQGGVHPMDAPPDAAAVRKRGLDELNAKGVNSLEAALPK